MTAYDDLPDHVKIHTPPQYTAHPSGIEIIEVTRHLGFDLGNAVKYVARHAEKHLPVLDLGKGQWYLNDAVKYDLLHVPKVAARKLLILATYDENSGDPVTGPLTGEFYRAVAALADNGTAQRVVNALAAVLATVERIHAVPVESVSVTGGDVAEARDVDDNDDYL